MAEHDNTNRGSIWKNAKKEKDTHPDFTGSMNVNGEEFWVSAWKRKEGASDKAPALSFSIKPKDEQAKQEARQPAKSQPQSNGQKQGSSFDDFEDSIPF
jgi:hypothetical protein